MPYFNKGAHIVNISSMGGFQGSLSSVSATELGSVAIQEAVTRAGIKADDVQEVIMGNVLPAGLKQGPARQASRQAGLPDATGCTTINKLCGSGMKAAMLAHDLIKAGTNNVMVAGGMESMSNAPYILLNARKGYRMGHGDKAMDHMFLDGLEDAETGRLMGSFAQDVASQKGYTREEMDNYAINSLRRAQKAIEEGRFDKEIAPLAGLTMDETPRQSSLEKMAELEGIFGCDKVTAAVSSQTCDGSSAVLVVSQLVRLSEVLVTFGITLENILLPFLFFDLKLLLV